MCRRCHAEHRRVRRRLLRHPQGGRRGRGDQPDLSRRANAVPDQRLRCRIRHRHERCFTTAIKQIQPQTKVEHVLVTNVKEYLPPLAQTLFTLTREKKGGHRIEQLGCGRLLAARCAGQYAGKKPDVDGAGDDMAVFQYTGGTTGVSKAAMGQHKRAGRQHAPCVRAWTTLTEGELARSIAADVLSRRDAVVSRLWAG